MKVAILNYSGSVGKTVVASHLLAPRMHGAQIFAVESTNETAQDLGLEVDQLKGEQFDKLFRDLMLLDDAIVDVGASNIEDFLIAMSRHEGSVEELDYFVLPVIGTGKAQRETLKTVTALNDMGVSPEKIRVLFNRVEVDVSTEFESIFAYEIKSRAFIANAQAVIYESEVFELLANEHTTIQEVLADSTNYRALIRETDKKDPHIHFLINRHVMSGLAKPVQRHLDKAFTALFAQPQRD